MKLLWKYLKLPTIIFGLALLFGVCLGIFLISPTFGDAVADLSLFKVQQFVKIAANNCGIIMLVYLSVVFSRKYAYYVYAINGFVLGTVLGWILKTNTNLMWLIVPHGIFEIPIILSTGYIVNKGEVFVRQHFKKYLWMFVIHEVCTLLCAGIEAFITPYFQRFI